VTAPVEVVEVATAPVKVVEAELSSSACKHSTQGAHSPRAPLEPELEEPAAVEAPDDVGTPAPAHRSMQEVVEKAVWPRVARREALGRVGRGRGRRGRAWYGGRHHARVRFGEGHRNHG
jgi:hypothetical protein